MMMTSNRLRQIGWGVLLVVCIAAFIVLSLRVHALRNEVLLAEIDIVALEKKKQRLETEFQARASQHQLARWNRVELGFVAPRADQYLDTRRQLAALGQPLGPNAPAPIRVARADPGEGQAFARRAMVSPVSGEPITLASVNGGDEGAGTLLAEAFGDLLIDMSPIRPAKAQTGPGFAGEPAE
jgi:hypothetical protein